MLHLRGPLGAFMLQENSIRLRCFVAGGTGLAPFLSMLRRMVDQSEIHSTRLFFAVRYEEYLFFREELALLTKQLPGIQVVFCVSRSNINWDGYHGNVLEALHQYLTEIDHSPDIYVCGSTRLVHGVTEMAGMFGIAESNVFAERFVSSLPQPRAILRG